MMDDRRISRTSTATRQSRGNSHVISGGGIEIVGALRSRWSHRSLLTSASWAPAGLTARDSTAACSVTHSRRPVSEEHLPTPAAVRGSIFEIVLGGVPTMVGTGVGSESASRSAPSYISADASALPAE
jgi:hypothetical protein